MKNNNSLFDEVISSYSRAQALEDGVLVDVSEIASEIGIHYPVAMTRAVWNQYVKIPPKVRMQDEAGRLRDVVWMLFLAIRKCKAGSDNISFSVHVKNNNRPGFPRAVELKSVCGPNDDLSPCITIMLPEED